MRVARYVTVVVGLVLAPLARADVDANIALHAACRSGARAELSVPISVPSIEYDLDSIRVASIGAIWLAGNAIELVPADAGPVAFAPLVIAEPRGRALVRAQAARRISALLTVRIAPNERPCKAGLRGRVLRAWYRAVSLQLVEEGDARGGDGGTPVFLRPPFAMDPALPSIVFGPPHGGTRALRAGEVALIEQALVKLVRPVQHCYGSSVARRASMRGQVVVSIETIGDQMAVSRIESDADHELETCITAAIESIHAPRGLHLFDASFSISRAGH